jgi:hypothetical protein
VALAVSGCVGFREVMLLGKLWQVGCKAAWRYVRFKSLGIR